MPALERITLNKIVRGLILEGRRGVGFLGCVALECGSQPAQVEMPTVTSAQHFAAHAGGIFYIRHQSDYHYY